LWQPQHSENPRIVATYDYTNERGNLLYQVVRYQPKDFKQRRPNGCGGWTWKKYPTQVLYRLPEVLEAAIVFVVEGEKDVETLRSHGFAATTNAGGAKAPWLASFTETLRGREVVLIPDNDAPGRARVLTIARALLGKAARLIVLELEDGKDISDWFDRGHSETELITQVEGPSVRQ
jgi:5S rRNA maturation endonuclease (ribonuclease M5)